MFGYDIEYAAHRYITRGLKYHPDLVIWFVKNDDFSELADISLEKIDEYSKKTPEEITIEISQIEKHVALPQALREPFEKISYIVNDELHKEVSQKQFMDIQTNAVYAVADSADIPVVLFTFNTTDSMYKARMKVWKNTRSNILPYFDIRNVADHDATFAPHNGHPTRYGYDLMSDDMFAYLTHGVIPCLPVK